MTPIEVLKAVRKLIEDPKNWIKGNWATNGRGRVTPSASPKAKRWDLAGAFNQVNSKLTKEDLSAWFYARQFVRAVIFAEFGDYEIIEFNDDPEVTHAQVLKIIDLAVDQMELNNG